MGLIPHFPLSLGCTLEAAAVDCGFAPAASVSFFLFLYLFLVANDKNMLFESLPGSLEEEEEMVVGADHVVLIAWG